jgi:hypothetical protein
MTTNLVYNAAPEDNTAHFVLLLHKTLSTLNINIVSWAGDRTADGCRDPRSGTNSIPNGHGQVRETSFEHRQLSQFTSGPLRPSCPVAPYTLLMSGIQPVQVSTVRLAKFDMYLHTVSHLPIQVNDIRYYP